MKKRIITDIDNTLFDFSPHFECWAKSEGHSINEGVLGKTYDFQSMFDYEIDPSALVNQFFDCSKTMGSFAALPDTAAPLLRLRERGYDFVAVTGCNHREGLVENRLRNLHEVFGFEFDNLFLTGYGDSKTEILKRYGPSVWVEDSFDHAVDGAQIGHRTFLIDHPYNQGGGPFTRVRNWLEIEDRLCTAS